MSKKGKVGKEEYIQMAAESSRSEDQIRDKNGQSGQLKNNQKQDQSFLTRNKTCSGLIGLIVAILAGIVIKQSFFPEIVLESQYRFTIYCPITSNMIQNEAHYPLANDLREIQAQNDLRVLTQQLSKRLLTEDNDQVDKYIIYVQENNITQDGSSVTKFTYCSWVANWTDKDCSKAYRACSVPGPIFYIQQNQVIDVAWVYNLNEDKGIRRERCFKDPNNIHCQLLKKKQNNCTYVEPATQLYSPYISDQRFQINTTSIPISVHIHGLEVRPAFDGNPLAWFGPGDQLGSGYQSLILNQKYFETFRDIESTKLIPESNGRFYYKVNRYHNFQPPGNLWYHDHSMHITQMNVMLGMAGDYIIHDKKVDSQLPNNQHEIFIVAGSDFRLEDGNTNSKNSDKIQQIHKKSHGIRRNPSEVRFASQTNLTFERNQTYRIRILNAQYDSVFEQIRFVSQCDQSKGTLNISSCKTLSFTVIGSDSCLFSTTIPNTSNLTLASAQRFEILIVFDGLNADGRSQNPISPKADYVYLVTKGDTPKSLRLKYPLNKVKSVNKHPLPQDISKIEHIEFYNLTQPYLSNKCQNGQASPSCLSMERMRPFFTDSLFNFYFNGHYKFGSSGASDNPKIGTTEDWYFINTIFFGHPIHVHLINYQIIARTSLAAVTYVYQQANSTQKNNIACSYYEMNYYMQAGIIQKLSNASTYFQICKFLRNEFDVSGQTAYQTLKNFYPQNQLNQGSEYISGFDFRGYLDPTLLDPISSAIPPNVNQSVNCPTRKHKYICEELSTKDLPDWYRRWKEVAYIPEFTIFQIRIRWTSTYYNTSLMTQQYPYFSVPEDQLIQYPGYVYHCHFLQHQDNELMRSFMMQPSDKFTQNYNSVDSPISECVQKEKQKAENKGKTEWGVRSICINKYVGCQ